MSELARAEVVIGGNDTDLQNTLARSSRSMQQTGRKMQRIGARMTATVTAPLVGLGAAAVKMASDAEESANKFDVVMGGAAERVRDRFSELAATIPLTTAEMEGMASGIQDLLVPMGVARQEAAGMSADMVQLAGDLASFNNVSPTRVLEAMKSALAGSSEPMRRFGVDTRVARLETLALREGLIEVGEELDNAATAQAVMLAIQEDSTDAMGDAARTADSTANRMKFLARDVKQLGIDFGQTLLPAARDFLRVAQSMMERFNDLSPAARENIARFGALTAAMWPVVFVAGTLKRALGGVTAAFATLKGAQITASVSRWVTAFGRWAIAAGSLRNALRLLKLALAPTLVGAVAVLAGMAVKNKFDEWGEAARKAAAKVDRLEDSLDGLIEKSQDLSRAQIATVISSEATALTGLQRQIAATEAALESALRVPQSRGGRLGIGGGGDRVVELRRRLETLRAQADATRDAISQLREIGQAAAAAGAGTGGGGGGGTGTGVGTPAPTRPTVVDAFLRSFGVPSVDELMSAVQRRFNVLSDRLDPSKQTGFQGFGDFQATGAAAMDFGGFSGELTGEEDFSKLGEAFSGGIEKANKAAERHLDIWKRIGQAVSIELSNAMTDLLTGVKDIGEGLKGLFMSILDTVQRIVTRIAVNQFLESAGLSFAGGFATGGTIPSGSFGVVGERGPELVRGPAKVTPMAAGGGGEPITVHQKVEFNVAAMDARSVQQILKEQKGTIAAIVGEAAAESTGLRHRIVRGR